MLRQADLELDKGLKVPEVGQYLDVSDLIIAPLASINDPDLLLGGVSIAFDLLVLSGWTRLTIQMG
ncbi:MAG: hypothetical protein AAF333_12300 [Planctomycetota bacterium]